MNTYEIRIQFPGSIQTITISAPNSFAAREQAERVYGKENVRSPPVLVRR